MDTHTDRLFAGLQRGEKGCASRLMSLIENEGPEAEAALRRLYTTGLRALVIGVTGWPGVGKSSLVSRIAKSFLGEGKKVGIVAVDPTSPISGGGLLGDRIRLRDIEGRENLFIRSVASRGHHGGLSRSARPFVKILEAMGCDVVLLETVGVGQNQTTVSLIADTTIIVVAPGLGDYLQAIKSGILEIGDIFVVNKADRPDADKAALDLESAIQMREKEGWRPTVVKTIAIDGTGIEDLMREIQGHTTHCSREKDMVTRKISAAKDEIREAVKARLLNHFMGKDGLTNEATNRYAREICERKTDPYVVADIVLRDKGIN
ncbi:MAG TPA: methylmalonyl Co-A mutase-associated GTPase MeaB [Syntrophorhabdaceae bacterium]|nr:methylmalonyl Co-A mutase-associated GTPase MeaB [Syntrophorhabdaceae bacterium]